MYTVLVDEGAYGMDSRRLLRQLAEADIQTRPLWEPLHLSRVYAGMSATDCPVAERLYAQALSLPCSVGLRSEEQERTIAAIRARGGR
jgi:perosamine synthetase